MRNTAEGIFFVRDDEECNRRIEKRGIIQEEDVFRGKMKTG
jgi:hypothetical protein